MDQANYEAVEADALMELVNRMKAAVMLMNSIAAKKNYRNILINSTLSVARKKSGAADLAARSASMWFSVVGREPHSSALWNHP